MYEAELPEGVGVAGEALVVPLGAVEELLLVAAVAELLEVEQVALPVDLEELEQVEEATAAG